MRELAFLNAGITITLTDMREKDENGVPRSETFHSKDGLKEFVRYIDSSRIHLFNDVIYLNTEKQGVPIEVAIMYNTENIHSYVNNINTIEGGTHLAGFRTALTRTLKKYAEDEYAKELEKLEKNKVEISGEDFREGLTAVIVPWKHEATKLVAALGNDAPQLVDATGALPRSGCVLLTLPLAKGLEFDHVIIPNASAGLFPADDRIAKNRLYTSISRATRELDVFALGELTPLLR